MLEPIVSAMRRDPCCADVDLVEAPPNAKVSNIRGGVGLAALCGDLCLNCGQSYDITGAQRSLHGEELLEWRARWRRRRFARTAVANGVVVSIEETQDSFPDPFWLPTMGLSAAVSSAVLSGIHHTPQRQLTELRALFGLTEDSTFAQLSSPTGPVTVDQLYFEHLYEVDPATGRNRIDEDHVRYSPLISRTLAEPLEVYRQQTRGKKSRKEVFLAM